MLTLRTATRLNITTMELVEREDALEALEECMRSVVHGTGRVAFIAGEAGVGKTSLLKALAARHGRSDIWWGNCDALQTPHPLAPLHDIARSGDVRFAALLAGDADRSAVFEAVLAELRDRRNPVLMVIEDAHWADEATLDLIKFLGRRIDRVACLLVVSYRDDEVSASHPLRQVFGELPNSLVERLDLRRLTPQGVELLARRALQSLANLYSITHGNPFFVTELLRHGADGVPRSVQDLVLARFAKLDPAAQAVVRLTSAVPAKIERWLIDEVLEAGDAAIDECISSGLLIAADDALSFRHELARVAIETSLTDPNARSQHAQILRALVKGSTLRVPLARVVHHAAHARDAAAIVKYAPEAARQAQMRGAHREAAAHYAAALGYAASVDESTQADWLEAYGSECQLIGRLDNAIDARVQLGSLLQHLGDAVGEAENWSKLALIYVLALRNREADAASRRAIELLEARPPTAALAAAYRVEAQLRMLNRECETAVTWSDRAIELAERFDDRETLAGAFNSRGGAMQFIDYQQGDADLQRALELSLTDGLHYLASNAYVNLGSGAGELYKFDIGERYLKEAIRFAQQHEIDTHRIYSIAWLALCEMYLGRWDEAAEHAIDAIEQTTTQRSTARVMALVALGRVRTRRGDPGALEVLDEALDLALASGTLQRLAPVRAARAETAWWSGDLQMVANEAQAALPLAAQQKHAWFAGEMMYWLWRVGKLADASEPGAEPFALQIAGNWRAAARAWEELGCPFEQARALCEGDSTAQVEALRIFQNLGAQPAAHKLREQMKSAGQRLPRGARASTQANPHQLTAREVEVLQLLCEGFKNSEIAERLCRSVRTVDHHLEAVFGKLNVTTRTEAMAAAARSGIHAKNRRVGAAI